MPPAMLGTETLAMVMSSTTMKLPTASRNPASSSAEPFSGIGSAEASEAIAGRPLAIGVDVDVHGEPDPERVLGQLVRVERDAHGQPLHDLDPVACGVLRRDDGEG